jgi:MFS family permease
MTQAPPNSAATGRSTSASWLPLIAICLAQMLAVLNPSVINTTIGAIVADLKTSATAVQTALVLYCLITAALMVTAGRLGKAWGALTTLRIGVGLYAVGLLVVSLTPVVGGILAGQAIAGIGTAILIPSLLALIVANYQGKQQAMAVAFLGAAAGIGGAIGLLVGGVVTGIWGWRYAYLVLVIIAGLTLALSLVLRYNPKVKGRLDLDFKSVLLSVFGMLSLVIGINQMSPWGLLLAKPAAPFSLLGVSPALLLFGMGLLLLQGFVAAQLRLQDQGRTPLLSPLVWDTALEQSALLILILTTAISTAVGFVVPLYVQLVQGLSAVQTGLILLPFALTAFAGAIVAANLAARYPSRTVVFRAQIVRTIGLVLLAFTFANEWGTPWIVLGLALTGATTGILISVLSMVLVSASPPELGGDVGALRGTGAQLGSALGPALVGIVLSTVLSSSATSLVTRSPMLPAVFKQNVDLSQVQFMSNEQLAALIDRSPSIDAAQKAELLNINQQIRLNALRVSLLFVAGLSLFGLVPSRDLPGRKVSGLAVGANDSI